MARRSFDDALFRWPRNCPRAVMLEQMMYRLPLITVILPEYVDPWRYRMSALRIPAPEGMNLISRNAASRICMACLAER